MIAAHTASQISGATSSLYTHQGGLQIKAAEGPVSLRAHTDTLSLLADQEIQILSVGDEITVTAKTKIELTGGDSSIVLDGADITFTTPGIWTAKGGFKEFVGGESNAAQIEALPVGAIGTEPLEIELNHHWPDLTPVAGAAYTVLLADGTQRSGKLDAQGYAKLTGLPAGPVDVVYGEDAKPFIAQSAAKLSITDDGLAADIRKLGFDPDDVDLQKLIEHESGRQI